MIEAPFLQPSKFWDHDSMKTLSSPMTFFFKRVFPVIWFGFLVAFMILVLTSFPTHKEGISLFAAPPDGRPPFLVFLLGPIVMAVVGYFIMRRFIWDLVDEVVDLGDALRIRHRSEEIRVPLGEIINVDRSQFVNPPRVTLLLRQPGKFGRTIAFIPAGRSSTFGTNPTIAALIERIDAARR